MAIAAATVKELRDRTGLGMMVGKKALVEEKRSGRATREGRIGQYIHGGKVGVLVELDCETDFVAKNEQFSALLKDLCMQVAASMPAYVNPEDVPADVVEKEKGIFAAQVQGKPEHIVEKILEGKLKDFYKQVCLLEQPFIKDGSVTVRDHVTATIARLGENISVKRFVRFEVGEED